MSGKSKAKPPMKRLVTTMARDRLFSLQIKLLPTNELFPLKKIYNEMRISELKNLAEYATGIPVNMQRLYYLDEGDLLDTTDVRSNDIVPGGILHMTVWNMWRTLVEAAAANDAESVFHLGVTQDTDYKTPTSNYMQPSVKQEWIANRAFIALYIAAHRGHIKLCKKLLDAGANVNGQTSLGHTPLHVAAAQGHGTIVDLLLERGADIDAVDNVGETAMSAACKFDHKDCERHLFLFRWQQRAKHLKPQEVCEPFAHQIYDSAFPVWLKGSHAQVYYTKILPPGEFGGTALSAPRRRPHSGTAPSEHGELSDSDSNDSVSEDDSVFGTSSRRKGGESLPPIHQDKALMSSAEIRRRKERNKKKALEYGRKKSERPKNYDEWLAKKEAVEQVKIDRKRQKEAAKKLAEEDKKRQQDFQDKSYEQWLADKETAKKGGVPPVGMATNQTSSTFPSTTMGTKKTVPSSTATGSHAIGQTTSNKNLIQSVIQKRQQELEARGMMSYSTWFGQDEGNLLEQIRAGKTPLQKVINQLSY